MSTNTSELSFKTVIAVVQYDPHHSNSDPISDIENLISKAQEKGAQIVYLPDNFSGLNNPLSITSTPFEKLQNRLFKKNMWLSLGGFYEKDCDNSVYKSHIFLNSDNKISGLYRKIHPYNDDYLLDDESKKVLSGNSLCAITDTPIGNQGLALSFDAYFPELSSIYRERYNCHVLVFPTSKRDNLPGGNVDDEWLTILRSRAVENQCYVISASQESDLCHVVDPWGRQLLTASDSVSLAGGTLYFTSVESELLNNVRLNMPMTHHKRADIFPDTFSVISQQDIGKKDFAFGHHVIPASCVFYRSKHSFAFVNISPLVPGHVLICPISVVPEFSALSHTQICDLSAVTQLVSKRIRDYHGADSYVIAQQDGPAAGQSVPHVHFHFQPRKDGDFGIWEDEDNQKVNSDPKPEENRKLRSLEEMSNEAETYRCLFYS